ncbi:MAG: hypothetical protein ACPGXZ_15620, partial [Saprospiraceae bacterium]
YGLIKKVLAADGVVVTQSTSPYFAPDAFWCIHNTMDTVFQTTIPYQTYVPTFGQWGFNVAVNDQGRFPNAAPPADVVMNILKENLTKENLTLKYMNPEMLPSMFVFGGDRKERITEINKLQNQILINLYEKNWDAMR